MFFVSSNFLHIVIIILCQFCWNQGIGIVAIEWKLQMLAPIIISWFLKFNINFRMHVIRSWLVLSLTEQNAQIKIGIHGWVTLTFLYVFTYHTHIYVSLALQISQAYADRVNLSAQGFYFTPDIGYDWSKGEGRPYNYYTYGIGCSEVEVDTLTGDFKVSVCVCV